jgi:(1->4)-alpha-D-glucan 1-alpha-D-glucosylmutase
MTERQRRWPGALSATSTHDTKRGEDVRARLNVLSEMPGAWKASVTKWRALNRRFKIDVMGAPAPDPNEEYLLYQTLVGVWPFEPDAEIDRRLTDYMTKALREAKVHTSWLSPQEEYEHAVHEFVHAILDRRRAGVFLRSFEDFQARVGELGIYNSLAQLLIKITAPGVPDFYQGTELWDLNLVDPDNRRPVDYAKRRALLAALPSVESCRAPAACAEELLQQRRDGRVKMFVATRALHARRARRHVFEAGAYVPLEAKGGKRDSVFAFARQNGDGLAITCVPRLITSLIPDGKTPPVGSAVWGDTRIELAPRHSAGLVNVFTGVRIEPQIVDGRPAIAASQVFERFPVALLVQD